MRDRMSCQIAPERSVPDHPGPTFCVSSSGRLARRRGRCCESVVLWSVKGLTHLRSADSRHSPGSVLQLVMPRSWGMLLLSVTMCLRSGLVVYHA